MHGCLDGIGALPERWHTCPQLSHIPACTFNTVFLANAKCASLKILLVEQWKEHEQVVEKDMHVLCDSIKFGGQMCALGPSFRADPQVMYVRN